MDDYDDIFNSPSVEESFQQATLIATLAEKFGMTSFKPFQKNVISATLDGRDTLVIHPTGSGKSLFPVSPGLPEQESNCSNSNH